jgi:hypothetical protein
MIRKRLKIILVLCVLMAGCSNTYHQFVSNYAFTVPAGVPDYSSLDLWAAHPAKWDPSDSVPQPLRSSYYPDTSVDVFFVYPTTYTALNRPSGWNANLDDADLNSKTDYSTILKQASIFNEYRIFSPRYRQANLSAYYPKTTDDTLHALAAFDRAYQDVKAAFIYYMEHQNHGHPIIIASHSQGTTHAKHLLKEFFDGKELQKKLVAAYLIGMPLEPDYFSSIKPCNTPNQTACACSWRTFKEGYKPAYVEQEPFVSIVTNPLTWDVNISSGDRSLNKGGVLLNFNKLEKEVSNAIVSNSVLWTDKPHFFGNVFLTSKNYHIADMNLFYVNIRENVKQRVEAYQKK